MSRDIAAAISGALDDSIVSPLFAVELLFDSPNIIRLWTGIGDLVYDGDTYTGSGNLLSISTVEEVSDISARGAKIVLSGIPSEVISLALATPYQGRVCNIYFGVTVDGTSTFSSIFSGYMDTMNISNSAETSTVQISVENKLIDLERTRVRRWSSAFQKSLYPNDKGFDFVEDLQDKEVFWGKATPD